MDAGVLDGWRVEIEGMGDIPTAFWSELFDEGLHDICLEVALE